MTHGVQATKGHVAGNGGLRGHSCGEVFPFVVYQRGTPDDLYHWVLQPNGLRIGPFREYDKAENLAMRLKLTGQLPKDDPMAVDAVVNAPTHDYYVDEDGLEQRWRWRCRIGQDGWESAEFTPDYGKTWKKSGHRVKELRGVQSSTTFRSIGTDPLWQS